MRIHRYVAAPTHVCSSLFPFLEQSVRSNAVSVPNLPVFNMLQPFSLYSSSVPFPFALSLCPLSALLFVFHLLTFPFSNFLCFLIFPLSSKPIQGGHQLSLPINRFKLNLSSSQSPSYSLKFILISSIYSLISLFSPFHLFSPILLRFLRFLCSFVSQFLLLLHVLLIFLIYLLLPFIYSSLSLSFYNTSCL